jgi:hypothetical protein
MTGFTGGCLCGAVRFKSTADPQIVGHCHCVDCRKSSGTGHCTHLVIPEAAFSVTGAVTFYDRAADSGNIVSRGFCGRCGSPIYSTNSGMPGVVFPRASVLDNPEAVTPQMIVYASRAPAWDHMDRALPSFAIMPEGGPQKAVAGSRPS